MTSRYDVICGDPLEYVMSPITPMTLVSDLGLSTRAYNVLRFEYPEVKTVWQLAEIDPHELLRCPNMGRKSVKEIEGILSLCGLCLKHHKKGDDFQKFASFYKFTRPVPWFAFCL